jgi:hypothetical protein
MRFSGPERTVCKLLSYLRKKVEKSCERITGSYRAVTGADKKRCAGSSGWNLFRRQSFGAVCFVGIGCPEMGLGSFGISGVHGAAGWWETDGGARRDIAGEGKSARLARLRDLGGTQSCPSSLPDIRVARRVCGISGFRSKSGDNTGNRVQRFRGLAVAHSSVLAPAIG